MKLTTQPYKGARDFYPEDMRVQNYIFTTWRNVCHRFGYEEYMTPLLESTDIYLAKTSEEIVREQTYTFIDRGERSVTIRPEMTPSLARLVAGKRQEIGYPARMFSIANFWRYERAQRGRLREFWQLNADIFGIEGIGAEQECITLADQILQEFGAKRTMYEIRVNSRMFINYLLNEYLGFENVEVVTLVRLIDRIDKMSRPEFIALAEAAVRPAKRDDGTVAKLLELLDSKEIESLPDELQGHTTLRPLHELLSLLEADGVTNAVFDIKLMRGFDYYTDIVFEAFDTHPDNNRAMFGGGRYDGLVGQFGVEPVATFGFAPGDVATKLFLESHNLLPKLQTETELYVALAGVEYKDVAKLLRDLRKESINVAVDPSGKKLGAQIKNAEKKGIQYLIVMGEQEITSGRFTLKNLSTSKSEDVSFERLVSIVKDRRTE